jgi:hypothetical protein
MLLKAAPDLRIREKYQYKLADWSINALRDTEKYIQKYIHETSGFKLEYHF